MNEECKWFPRRSGLVNLVEGIKDGSIFDLCVVEGDKDNLNPDTKDTEK